MPDPAARCGVCVRSMPEKSLRSKRRKLREECVSSSREGDPKRALVLCRDHPSNRRTGVILTQVGRFWEENNGEVLGVEFLKRIEFCARFGFDTHLDLFLKSRTHGGFAPLQPPNANAIAGRKRDERVGGKERAGARLDSLALRCPVASQPVGPGSWAINQREQGGIAEKLIREMGSFWGNSLLLCGFTSARLCGEFAFCW